MTTLLLPTLLVITSSCLVIHSSAAGHLTPKDIQTMYRSKAIFESERIKRFLIGLDPRRCCPSLVSKSGLNGTIAQTVLLHGALPIGISFIGGGRYYVKPGFYEDALADFNKVNPTNINSYTELPHGVNGFSGNVGNLDISVVNKGESGRPTMELSKGLKVIKTITYTGEGYLFK